MHALRWCTVKGDQRKPRKMTGRLFSDLLYALMEWDKANRYKILGYKIEFEGEELFVFDLKVAEIFECSKKVRKAAASPVDGEMGQETENPTKVSRKGYYSPDIANTFGVSIEEQLVAAQAANDPERINQATQAVTNAQTALNNANAAVKNTEAQLQAVNNELTLASNGWYSAGEAMRTAQAAITTIGNDISLAESEFRKASPPGIASHNFSQGFALNNHSMTLKFKSQIL